MVSTLPPLHPVSILPHLEGLKLCFKSNTSLGVDTLERDQPLGNHSVMAFNETERDAEDGCTSKCNESSPLLSSQHTTRYVDFPKPASTETWTPSAGFWWIETGETTDRLLH